VENRGKRGVFKVKISENIGKMGEMWENNEKSGKIGEK